MGFGKDAGNNSGVPFYYYQGASIDQTKRNRKGATSIFTHGHICYWTLLAAAPAHILLIYVIGVQNFIF
jgi:hypothetical protein